MPTSEQAIASVLVCQMLSSSLRDIILFPCDNQAREIYILAGENIQVIIPSSGEWEFIND